MGDRHASHQGGGLRTVLQVSGITRDILSLNLAHNRIFSLKDFGNFTWLTDLNISNNCVESMDGLSFMPLLRTVDLSLNNISRVQDLGSLKDLLRLNLSGNRLVELSGFHEMWSVDHRLEELDLSDNPFLSDGRREMLNLIGIRSLADLNIGEVLNRGELLRYFPALYTLNNVNVSSEERRNALLGTVGLFPNSSPVSGEVKEHPRVVPVPYSDPRTEAELAYRESEVQRLTGELNSVRELFDREKQARMSLDDRIKEKDKEWSRILRKADKELEEKDARFKVVKESLGQMEGLVESSRDKLRQVQSEHETELREIGLKIDSVHLKYSEDIGRISKEKESLEKSVGFLEDELGVKEKAIELLRQELEVVNRNASIKEVSFRLELAELSNEISRKDSVHEENLRSHEAKASQECQWLAEQVESTKKSDESNRLKIDRLEQNLLEITQQYELAKVRESDGNAQLHELSKVLLVSNRRQKEARKELETLKAEYSKGLGQIETVVSARMKCLQERLDSKEKQLLGEAKLREELQVDLEALSQRLTMMVDDERLKHDETRNNLALEHREKLSEVQNELNDAKSRNACLSLEIQKMTESFNEKCMQARVQEQLVKDLSDHVDELKKDLNGKVRSCLRCEERVEDAKSLNREIELLNHTNAEIHLTLKEKDETIAYISSEISGIKNVYEEKLSSEKKELEKQHAENISRVQKKLHDAARIMAKLESKLHEQQDINSALKRELCGMNESKLKAQQENQEKLNRISHLFNVLCDK